MNRAEKYLNERMNYISNERVILLTKIDETDLEIKEIEYKISDLRNSIDDTFEIFSPRTRKNDFLKNEIECLKKKIDTLTSLKDEYKVKADEISEDIDIIKDILSDNTEEDNEDNLDIYDDEIYDNKTQSEDSIDMVNFNSETLVNNSFNDKEKERLLIEKERLLLAGKIEEKTLQSVSNLIHKCEVCVKVLDVDRGRAKLEIEMMHKSLDELYNTIRKITGNLRNSVGENTEPVKNASVKKLSKDKFFTMN